MVYSLFLNPVTAQAWSEHFAMQSDFVISHVNAMGYKANDADTAHSCLKRLGKSTAKHGFGR